MKSFAKKKNPNEMIYISHRNEINYSYAVLGMPTFTLKNIKKLGERHTADSFHRFS